MNSLLAGRFVLECCTFEEGMHEPEWGYVTSWDYFSEARTAVATANGRIPVGFRLTDDKTGKVWRAGDSLV